jgi:hypothetical protein
MRKLLMLLVALAASGDVAAAGFTDGNRLLTDCRASQDEAPHAICLGYVTGAYDMATALSLDCPNERYTVGQVRDIVVKFLVDNPRHRHLPAALLVARALVAELGCNLRAGG